MIRRVLVYMATGIFLTMIALGCVGEPNKLIKALLITVAAIVFGVYTFLMVAKP